MILHDPVPTVGALAANVTVVNPQVAALVWLGPALAVVGANETVAVTANLEVLSQPDTVCDA